MWCRRCLGAMGMILVVAGCRAQNATLSNPFLAPDRVPPPATRALVPGTAQPYYPGDPVPNSPAVVPPGAAFPNQNPPVVPPGGWNTAPGVSAINPPSGVQPVQAELPAGPIVTVAGQRVQVPDDTQNLRFAPPAAPAPLAQQPAVTPAYPSGVVPATGTGWEGQYGPGAVTAGAAAAAPPTGSVYPGQQTGLQSPVSPAQRPVQLRAVPASQPSGTGNSAAPADGFRPQGSAARVSSVSTHAAKPPSPDSEDPARFGYAPNYQWLRGQLAYEAGTGQWQLRYRTAGQGRDELGGQVVIANPHVLGGIRPGEHVQLRGQLETPAAGGLPVYRVVVVQRQQI